MRYLEKGDELLRGLMEMHGLDLNAAAGGCRVTWAATLDWDNEGENHEGDCVFGLVPPKGFVGNVEEWDGRVGRMVRDRGYAEGVPIVGRFWMDEENGLCLETPYDGGMVEEKFSYEGGDCIVRTSAVRRFGGLASTTYAVEKRVGEITEDGKEVRLEEEKKREERKGKVDLEKELSKDKC